MSTPIPRGWKHFNEFQSEIHFKLTKYTIEIRKRRERAHRKVEGGERTDVRSHRAFKYSIKHTTKHPHAQRTIQILSIRCNNVQAKRAFPDFCPYRTDKL